MRVTARKIQVALGLLWLLDGALQLQPFMFGRGFAQRVIAPTADGQPQFVAGGVHWATALILTHPAAYDTVFALVQIALGIGLLIPATARLALAGSIGWGLGVWYFGEGLGGISSGHALMLTGAPGAALLYVVLSVALWPKVARRTDGSTVRTATVAAWLPLAWAALWVGSAVFGALPGQNTGNAISQAIEDNADGAPGWLAAIDRQVAQNLHGAGLGIVIGLAMVQLVIGVAGLARGWARTAAVWVGTILSLAFWVVGQSLGELYSGQATDPSTSVVVVLLGAAVLTADPASRIEVAVESRKRAGVRSAANSSAYFLAAATRLMSGQWASHPRVPVRRRATRIRA